MEQKIESDRHGLDTWDENRSGRVFVHIVNSDMYEAITGKRLGASPISARTYTEHGYPWYDLYDEGVDDIPGSSTLDSVKSVKEIDNDHGFVGQQDDSTIWIPGHQVKTLPATPGVWPKRDSSLVSDGAW
jgi:hypothetical protein